MLGSNKQRAMWGSSDLEHQAKNSHAEEEQHMWEQTKSNNEKNNLQITNWNYKTCKTQQKKLRLGKKT